MNDDDLLAELLAERDPHPEVLINERERHMARFELTPSPQTLAERAAAGRLCRRAEALLERLYAQPVPSDDHA